MDTYSGSSQTTDKGLTYDEAEILSFIKLLQACPCLWHKVACQQGDKQNKINAYLLLMRKRKEHSPQTTFQSVREHVLELVNFVLPKQSINDNISRTDIREVTKYLGEKDKSTFEDDIVEKILKCNKLLSELSFIENHYRTNLKNIALECQFCYCKYCNFSTLWSHMIEKHLPYRNKKRKPNILNSNYQEQKEKKTCYSLRNKRRKINALKYKSSRFTSKKVQNQFKSIVSSQCSSLIKMSYNLRSKVHRNKAGNKLFQNKLSSQTNGVSFSMLNENEETVLERKQNAEKRSTSLNSLPSQLRDGISKKLRRGKLDKNLCNIKSNYDRVKNTGIRKSKKSRGGTQNRNRRSIFTKSSNPRKTRMINTDFKMQPTSTSSSSIGVLQLGTSNVKDLSEDSKLSNLLKQIPAKDNISSKSDSSLSVYSANSGECMLRKTKFIPLGSIDPVNTVLKDTQFKKYFTESDYKENTVKKEHLTHIATDGITHSFPECNASFCKCATATKSVAMPVNNDVKLTNDATTVIHMERASRRTTKAKLKTTQFLPNSIKDETAYKSPNATESMLNTEVKVIMEAKEIRNSDNKLHLKMVNNTVSKDMDWRQPKSFYQTEDSVSNDSEGSLNIQLKREIPLNLKKTVTKKTLSKKFVKKHKTKKTNRCQTKKIIKCKNMGDALKEFSESFLKNFIQLYRSNECLWKRDHKLYNNQQTKAAAYKKLMEIYKDGARDADVTLEKVKRLIRKLRFYHRQLSKGIEFGVLNKKRIYKKLEFLKDGLAISFPNTCSTCYLTFCNALTLKQHAKEVHNEKKPFKCASCDLRFKYKVEMSRHYKNTHQSK